jgi:hypothetical protein
MDLKIVKAKVVKTGYGTDSVFLYTKLKGACWPYDEAECLNLKFDAASGTGADYVRKNFPGLELEVIELPQSKIHFVGPKEGYHA